MPQGQPAVQAPVEALDQAGPGTYGLVARIWLGSARAWIDFRVLRHLFLHLAEKDVRSGFAQDLGLRKHASGAAILAAAQHNPFGVGWSMPRARGGLFPYKRSWQNGNPVNFQARRYSKGPQKSGSQKKFALMEFSEGQLNPLLAYFWRSAWGSLKPP